jgi:hypothetical protein
MGLGTKNRQTRTAEICREHLRATHRDKLALVEEYIAEFEAGSEAPSCWSRFCDAKRDNREMLERLETDFQAWLNPQ